MHRIQAEQGAVLLILVLVLVMGSGTAIWRQGLSAQLQGGASDAAQYLTAEKNIQRLNFAKEALLSAAVTYADNYGPRGAGPGHFPCPDLDPPDDGNTGNDGPDPPCGSAEKQIGRVPRLTLATRPELASAGSASLAPLQSALNRTKLLEFYPRLSFQDRQPWYVVDNAFINSPTNRIVNADTAPRLVDTGGRAVVAALITPGKALPERNQLRPGVAPADYIESLVFMTGRNNTGPLIIPRDHSANSNDQWVYIYRDELMPLVYRRVADYVADLLLHKAAGQCPESVDVEQGVLTATSECLPLLLADALDGDNEGHVEHVGQGQAGQAGNKEQTENADSLTCHLQSANDGADYVIGIENCPQLLIEDGVLEGVSANRHWLIKNQWSRHITLTTDSECMAKEPAPCVLTWRVDLDAENTEARANELSVNDSAITRVIRLHLKGMGHEA